MVIRYIDRSQRHVWQALPGYIDHDWDDFCDELCEEYVNPTTEGQFSKQKLLDFTNKYTRKRMGDKTDVINYQHKFNSLGKTLLDLGCITKGEYNAIFWCGFHPEDRQELHERLIAKHPDKPKGQAFSIKDVLKIARAVFSGDNDFLYQEPPPRRNESDHTRERRTERSTCDQQESDRNGHASRRGRAHDPSPDQQHSRDKEALYSDKEEQLSRAHRHSSPRVKTRTVRFKDNQCGSDNKELEDMVGRLHDLSVRDKTYAILFTQCATRFPNAMLGIPKPEYRAAPATAAYSYQTTAPPLLTQQMWSTPAAAPVPTPVAPSANTSTAAPFFQFGPCPKTCVFCHTEGHRLRSCAAANEYIQSGRATWINDRINLPNGQPVPFDSSRHGLKASIDAWLALQTAAAPTPAQNQAIITHDPPPHLNSHNTSARIKEVIESHILQVREAPTLDEEEFLQDIFEVFAAEKKKCLDKAPELSALPPKTPAPAPTPAAQISTHAPTTNLSDSRANAQYRYQSNAEDQQLVSQLEDYLMQGKLSLTTPAHVLAASHAVRKNIAKKLKVRRVETNEYEEVPAKDSQLLQLHPCCATVHDDLSDDLLPSDNCPPDYCLPLLELDVLINNSTKVPAILDTGLQIVVIRHDIVQSLGVPINYNRFIEMEGANGATNWTVGCAENLPLQVGDVTFKVHAHVVKHASFGLLLGRPFQRTALCRFEDMPSGKVEVSVRDPADIERRVYLTTHPRARRAPAISVISVHNRTAPSLRPHSLTGDFTPTSCTFAHSQLLTSDPAPSNVEDISNALQQPGISTISRIGAQSQTTANPDTPDSEDSPAAEKDTATADDDGDGREERNPDASGDVRSPLYINFDKLARASNNNSNSYRIVGNEQDARDSRALGKHGKYFAIGSDTNTRHHRSNYSDNIDKHFDDTDINTANNNNNNNTVINKGLDNNDNNDNNSNSNSIIDNTNTTDNDNNDYNSNSNFVIDNINAAADNYNIHNSNFVIDNANTAADNYNSNNSNNVTTDTINISTLPFDTLSGTLNDKPVKFQTNDKANKADAETEQTSQRTHFDLPADSLTCFTSRAQAHISGGQNQHQQHRATHNSSSKAREGDFSLWPAFAHFTLSTDRAKSTSNPPSMPPKDFSATITANIDPAPDDTLDSGPVTSSASPPSSNNPPTILYLDLKTKMSTPRLPSSE